MPSRYSKPAIEFQAATQIGDRFLLRERTAKMLRMGQRLEIITILTVTRNPDDYLYEVEDDGKRRYQVRSWWLRKCCDRIN